MVSVKGQRQRPKEKWKERLEKTFVKKKKKVNAFSAKICIRKNKNIPGKRNFITKENPIRTKNRT